MKCDGGESINFTFFGFPCFNETASRSFYTVLARHKSRAVVDREEWEASPDSPNPAALQFWRSPDATTNADDSLKRYAPARRGIYDSARENREILMLSEQDGGSTSSFIASCANEAVIIFRDISISPLGATHVCNLSRFFYSRSLGFSGPNPLN